jgi:adenylylsulfate kinase-like enzyme
MKKIDKNKGILFWITGLSGSGKTTLGKKIHKNIIKKFGPTLMVSGDDIRKIFKLKGFESNQRLEITKKYSNFAKYVTDQKINVIFAVVGMFDEPRKWNKLKIKNYIEIFIKSNIKNIIRINKKKIYKKKNPGKLIGIDIKPQYPKKPDIIISNSFKLTSDKTSKILMKKIINLTYEKK